MQPDYVITAKDITLHATYALYLLPSYVIYYR